MIPKYKPILKNIFAYINNRLEAEISSEVVAGEVVNKFPTYLLFHNIAKEMQLDVAEALVYQAEFYKNRLD